MAQPPKPLNPVLAKIWEMLQGGAGTFKISPYHWLLPDTQTIIQHKVGLDITKLKLTLLEYENTVSSSFTARCQNILPKYMNVTRDEVVAAKDDPTKTTVSDYLVYLTNYRFQRALKTAGK